MYDPLSAARDFQTGYGIEPISFAERAHAASAVNMAAASLTSAGGQCVGALWELLGHLEGGAIDAVLTEDYTWAVEALADMVLDVYGVAARLGIERFYEIVGEVHRARMSALGVAGPEVRGDGKVLKSRRYVPAQIGSLVTLPA